MLAPFFGWLERGLSSAADVERCTGLPILGIIPQAPAALAAASLPAPALVVIAPASPFSRAVRDLRSALFDKPPDGDIQVEGGAKVVALTSALPGDGKTTCSLSLARQSAVEGFRTVLVDCDLRRPALTDQLAQPPRAGLLEVIEATSSLERALLRDTLTGLSLLPASRARAEVAPAIVKDLFGTEAMRGLIDRLRGDFDYVYLDTPPVLAVADTMRLVAFTDAVLIVSRWRKTPARAVTLALRRLDRTSANLVGFALTRAAQRGPRLALARAVDAVWDAVLWFDGRYGGTFARRLTIALIPPATVWASNLAFCSPS